MTVAPKKQSESQVTQKIHEKWSMQLIKWAEKESLSLEKAAQKTAPISVSNIYYSRKEWIDFVLIPKIKGLK